MSKQDLRNLEGNVVWFKGYIRGSGWGRQEGVFFFLGGGDFLSLRFKQWFYCIALLFVENFNFWL